MSFKVAMTTMTVVLLVLAGVHFASGHILLGVISLILGGLTTAAVLEE